MGFLSGLLGGSKSSVTQTSSNQTDVSVDVGVENTIDLSALADVLRNFGQDTQTLVGKLGNDTNALLQGIFAGQEQDQKLREAQVLLTLNGQAIEQDKAAQIKKLGRAGLAITASYLAYRVFAKRK